MKNVVFLTDDFYRRCVERGYREIERKRDRPYFVLIAEIDGVTWGLPFRSSIKHPHAFWTNREEGCGIDYSKAVVIENAADIDREKVPHIRDGEFEAVKGHEREIRKGFKSYVKRYKRAKASGHPRYASLVQFSTLQNYEHLLGM